MIPVFVTSETTVPFHTTLVPIDSKYPEMMEGGAPLKIVAMGPAIKTSRISEAL